MNFNRVIVGGHLTRDVELRYTPGGTAVTDLGMAINDRRKKDDEWVEETTYVDVTLWGRTAEIAGEYLSKGSPVLIEGRLKLDTWQNNEGEKRSKLKIVCDKMQLVGGRGNGGGGGAGNAQPQTTSQPSGGAGGAPDDDIPF
jgi:single-strand DNA-binding protein